MKPLELKEFIVLVMLLSSSKRVMRASKLFQTGRKKYAVFSVSRVHKNNKFKVSAKLCLN